MMAEKKFPPGKILGTITPMEWLNKSPFTGTTKIYPRSINFEDIDKAVFKWFNDHEIVIENMPLPAFFLTPEKWAEFKLQWRYMDADRKVDFPYITIRRSGFTLAANPAKGRIPGKRFTIYKQPEYTPAGPTMMHYRVPQPIKVDMEYEVRVLTHYVSESNVINEVLVKHFASLQAYLDIDKHYMPMLIESISDETEADNIDDERIMHTLYTIQVHGYIIDESEFEKRLGVSDIIVKIDEQKD
jgi:hypothetical protein